MKVPHKLPLPVCTSITAAVLALVPAAPAVSGGPRDHIMGRACDSRAIYPKTSENFVLWAARNDIQLAKLLEHCEASREQLQTRWLGASAPQRWRPRCEIVVHDTRNSYLRATGQANLRSLGASRIRRGSAGITSRRIDVLVDASGELPALAHELSHVVLADHFPGAPPPAWADEGIAMLADCERKRALHRRDARAALRSGTHLRLVELLTLFELPARPHVPAFYGQSLALVEYLTEHYDRDRLLPFLAAAQTSGYDRALQIHYEIPGIVELERRWRQQL